jgi:hypothetical protein
MSIREDVRGSLSDRGALRACLVGTAVLAIALLAMWPRGSLGAAVRTGQASDAFTVVAVCFLLVLLYLGARFGAEDFSADAGARFSEYVTLTPVSLLPLVGGRLVLGAVHTMILLLLGTPILIASMAVGGAGPAQALAALAMIGAAGLAARMAGLLALSVVGTRRPLRDMTLFALVAAMAAVTFFFTPAVSPFRTLGALIRSTGSSPWLVCTAASLGAAAVLAAAALAALAGLRARANRRRAKGS